MSGPKQEISTCLKYVGQRVGYTVVVRAWTHQGQGDSWR